MRIFNYVAKAKNGEIKKGEIEAENESTAAKILTSKDFTPISIESMTESKFSFLNKVSTKDKLFIIRQLSTMINAGLPIAQSLKTLQSQSEKQIVKKTLEQIVSDIEGGATLSSAMGRFPQLFSELDVTLIASGETSGNLDKSLLRMAEQLEKQNGLVRKIRGALIYPLFIIIVVIVVGALMVTYVVPQMEGLYSSFNAKLPIYTKILVALSKFLGNYAIFVLGGIGLFVAYARYAIQKPTGRKIWDKIKLHIPALGLLLKKLYLARFSRTLSGLVSSGVALLDALAITAKSVGNVFYRDSLNAIAEKVKGGVNLSSAIKEDNLYPGVVAEMISVGEKTGELDNMLQNLADYYEQEFDDAVKSISTLIEPLIIVIIAVGVGFMLVAIMLPIYNFASVVK
jgi:type IV pilus assembly protein PilC